MGFGCLVELWNLDVWCSYRLCMFGGAMSFGYVWWSYGIWMFGGAMGFVCLVELCALDV